MVNNEKILYRLEGKFIDDGNDFKIISIKELKEKNYYMDNVLIKKGYYIRYFHNKSKLENFLNNNILETAQNINNDKINKFILKNMF